MKSQKNPQEKNNIILDLIALKNWEDIEPKIAVLADKDPELALQIGFHVAKERAKKDLFYLARTILGFKFLSEKTHRPLCEFIQNQKNNRKLILWPRFHCKTTICNTAYVIWLLINNPEARILILSATTTVARDMLSAIKGHFLQNERFRSIFPELCPSLGGDFGTQDHFDIPLKTEITKEHSVSAASMETNLTGKHWTVMIKDDCVTEQNSSTKELCEKLLHHNRLSYSLMDPGAEEIVIGTRYNFGDMYGYILENMQDVYKTEIKAVFLDEKKIVPLWPESFPLEEIEKKRKESNDYVFSCQFMNDPVDPATAIFKIEKVKQVKKQDLPETLNIFTTIDPAISEKATADYSVILTAGVDKDWNIYILDIERMHVKPDELIDKMISTYLRYKPFHISFEDVQFQKAVVYFFRSVCKQRNLNIPVKLLKRDTRESKFQRICALQPKVEFGELYVVEDCRNKSELLEEMRRYPKSRHDDILDALADVLRIGFPPYQSQRKASQPGTLAYWERLLENAQEMEGRIGNEDVDGESNDIQEVPTIRHVA
jgi:predicted phage terminase large subunit-like protein